MHDDDHDDEGPYVMGPPTFERPTLLSSCAMAATAQEAQFRVSYPNSLTRNSCVIALDDGARRVMLEVVNERWRAARFLQLSDRQPDISPQDVALTTIDGEARLYSEELARADMVVLVATGSQGEREASIIGRLAREKSVMTVGIIIAEGDRRTDGVVAAMRPSAAVLVIASGDDYLAAMLSALRA